SQGIEQAILFQTLWAASANFGTTETAQTKKMFPILLIESSAPGWCQGRGRMAATNPSPPLCQRDTLQTLRLRARRSRQASTAPAAKIIVIGSCRDYSPCFVVSACKTP